VALDIDVSSTKLNKNVIDGSLYIILKNTVTSVTSGTVITVTFSVTGVNSNQYNTIPQITITFVDPSAYQTLPVASSLTAPTMSTNKATFVLQCSQASIIYWGVGIYPSILNTQALDFQARIISPGLGLTSNFT